MRSKRETKRKPKRYRDGQSSDSEFEPTTRGGKEESDNESGSEYREDEDDDDDRCSTPESQKDTKCSVCRRKVTSSDKSLQCDECNEWCHIKCGGVTKQHYRQMVQLDESNIEIQWLCPPCEQQQPANAAKPNRAGQPALVPAAVPRVPPTKPESDKPPVESSAHSESTTPYSNQPKLTAPIGFANHSTASPLHGTSSPAAGLPLTTAGPHPLSAAAVAAPAVGMVVPPRPVSTAEQQNGSNGGGPLPPRVISSSAPTPSGRLQTATATMTVGDLRVRDLPFFPTRSVLLRPCALVSKEDSKDAQTQNLGFYLTQEQASAVNNGRRVETNGMVVYKNHILLRFTAVGPDNIQDDSFPKNVCLKVNNKICPLPNPKPVPANRPNMEAKRPPKPLVITSLCKLNTKSCLNQVGIAWTPSDVQYFVSIYLVEKLSPSDLLGLLKSRGQRDPEITTALIRSKLEDHDSDEIATTSCKVTMSCPLGMARMTYPTRASTCDHLQCFDADTYLRMNEKKPKWVCPVCNRPAYFDTLFLDGFYIQLLQSPKFRALATNDIVLNQDATWEPVVPEGGGVPADSDDDYDDPLMVAGGPTSAAAMKSASAAVADVDIIPVGPAVDADGAPILSQLAKLPIATPRQPPPTSGVVLNGSASAGESFGVSGAINIFAGINDIGVDDDNLLKERHYAPEDDYVDWNFSVKFFRFIRAPPSRPSSPLPPPTNGVFAPMMSAAGLRRGSSSGGGSLHPPIDSSEFDDNSSSSRSNRLPAPLPSRGGGRGGRAARGGKKPRGAANGARKRTAAANFSSGDSDEDSPVERPTKGGGRGRGRGRGSRGGGGASAAPPKRPRYRDSSEEEEEDEEEEESEINSEESEPEPVTVAVKSRKPAATAPSSQPAVTASGRPARNCRRSTNYAELEAGDDVLDYLLGN